MTTKSTQITETPEWRALAEHHASVRDTHLRELFAADPTRGETMTCEAGDLYLDWSKNRLTAETMRLLVALAERAGLRQRIKAMFSGAQLNVTERRPVLHVALRAPEGASILVDGHNVVPEVHAVLRKMAAFADRVRSGAWLGAAGRSATWSTSASAAPISDPPWPTRRSGTSAIARAASASSRMWTAPTCGRRRPI